MIFLIFPILEIFSIALVFWISLENVRYKYIHSKKLLGKWKFYLTKHPTDLDVDFNLLTSSRAFVPLASVLQSSFFEGFFGFVLSFFCFTLAFFFGAGFIHRVYVSILKEFWFNMTYNLRYNQFQFFFISNMVIFIPGRKRHLEKISSMGKMRQIIYLRLIIKMF